MISFNGGKYSPKKGDKGWYIPSPFIIIGKEYAYDANLDYEGFVVKEITDKKGKKVPIIGLQVHDCSDLKCGESCKICGKENPHVFLQKESKIIDSETHLKIEVCKQCGEMREVKSPHNFGKNIQGDKLVYKCVSCGYFEESKIGWGNLESLPTETPIKTVEECLGLDGMIEEVKNINLQELKDLWEESLSTYTKLNEIKGVAEDSLKSLGNSVFLEIKHKGDKAILEVSSSEESYWSMESILPYCVDDDDECFDDPYDQHKSNYKEYINKEISIEEAIKVYFKGTEYENLSYSELLKLYKELKQKNEELDEKIKQEKAKLIKLKMFKLDVGEGYYWQGTLLHYIFGDKMNYGTFVDVWNAVYGFQEKIKEGNL